MYWPRAFDVAPAIATRMTIVMMAQAQGVHSKYSDRSGSYSASLPHVGFRPSRLDV